MSISAALEAEIRRYYYVEKWRVGTISRQLHVHHTTVKRVLSQTGVAKSELLSQPSIIDPFRPFIAETLKKYPAVGASRLYAMACERGYPGGEDHFRHLIALLRPRSTPEAYLRLKTLPGEQGQVDWGHFGHITIGEAERALMAFVIVLSYSRKIFLRFYLNQKTENFLRGHEEAFALWGGVPRILLYDNLKSAVLERKGNAIRFNPTFLSFSSHYHFEPRPVTVARGNEKGRVERAIQYIRSHFFAAREWKDLEDLNAQADLWCQGPASRRPCPEDKKQSVEAVYQSEKVHLIGLPDNPYPTEEKVSVDVGKTPYVRFDLNDYSVPYKNTRCKLTVLADLKQVRILKGSELIATHQRVFGKGVQIENPDHVKTLLERKKAAHGDRGKHYLTHTIACGEDFLMQAAKQQYHLASIIKQLLSLLEHYGAKSLEIAMLEALSQAVPHPNRVRLNLEKARAERNEPPPIPIELPDDARVRELQVKPHALNAYDDLKKDQEDDSNE